MVFQNPLLIYIRYSKAVTHILVFFILKAHHNYRGDPLEEVANSLINVGSRQVGGSRRLWGV